MKIKVGQLAELQIELAGMNTEGRKVVGLLNKKLSLKTKYWLQKLLNKVTAENDVRLETEKKLFISLGAVEENGLLIVKATLEDGTPNPAIVELDSERRKLLDEEIDLGEFKFDINDFDQESEENYYTFLSVAFD